MSLPHPTNLDCFISSRSEAVKSDHGSAGSVKKSNSTGISFYEDNGSKERIKKMFKKADLSVSSYDTAWMAMVPSSVNPQLTPQFPSCLNWVLNNQLSDGSWGLSADRDATLIMDAISSTLACVLALKQWGTGERQINMGLEFIAVNAAASLNDSKQRKLIGFDIIFPGMIDQANSMDLNVPIRQGDLDALFKRRNLELASSTVDFPEGRRAYLSYVSEGVGIYQDWQMAMKYKRKNGSLLNSPSATAAAFSHLHDPDCLRYLNMLLADTFGDAVPTVHPQAIYTKLWIVDSLERLGIHHHFKEEIENVLQETYRYWVQGEEEIFEDTTTCAMVFRILRWHGYDVSSDALRRFGDEDGFRNTLEGYLGETGPVLELYKASQIVIHQDDVILEDISSWTRNLLTGFLKHDDGLPDKYLSKEVEHALKFRVCEDMERLANMRNIENYSNIRQNSRVLKTATRSCAIGNKDFLTLAVEDFNKWQLMHQEELKDLDRWIVEKRLHKLKFARQKQAHCYLTAAASMPTPQLSDARMSWAKNSVLATVIDDFVDVGGSREELENLIQLINKSGDVDISTECFSENVEILYSALHTTIGELGERAIAWQGRSLNGHMTKTWLDLLKAHLNEAKWSRKILVPTMDEYMANGLVTLSLGPILVLTLFFLGPQLSEDAVQSLAFKQLFELLSTYGRILNDIASYKRENEEGKLNSVTVQMIHSGVEEEEAIKVIKGMISSKTREFFRRCILGEKEEDKLLGSNNNSVIPRECRYLFWKMNVAVNVMYIEEADRYTSDKFSVMDAMKAMLQQPICIASTYNL